MGKVLVAYDDTEISRKATGRAATLLANADSMVLLYVVTDSPLAGTLGTSVCPEDVMSVEEAHLMINATAREVVERYGFQAVGLVRRGEPGPTIVETARERPQEHIVAGKPTVSVAVVEAHHGMRAGIDEPGHKRRAGTRRSPLGRRQWPSETRAAKAPLRALQPRLQQHLHRRVLASPCAGLGAVRHARARHPYSRRRPQ